MPRLINLVGRRFGRLLVVERDPPHKWVCKCDCGSVVRVFSQNLRRDHTQSCGCIARMVGFAVKTIHGQTSTPEFHTWSHIRQRCENPSNRRYAYYGGRGITVCERWHSFEMFMEDMGPRPSPGHSIERIDNSKGYEPGNCIWATRSQQMRNTRRTHFITALGEKRSLVEWSQLTGIDSPTIRRRLKLGWSQERAVTAPVRVRPSRQQPEHEKE